MKPRRRHRDRDGLRNDHRFGHRDFIGRRNGQGKLVGIGHCNGDGSRTRRFSIGYSASTLGLCDDENDWFAVVDSGDCSCPKGFTAVGWTGLGGNSDFAELVCLEDA